MTRLPFPDPAALPGDFPPEPMVRMLALSPATVRLFIDQAKAQFGGLELPDRDRELVVLAVAALTGCAFVTAEHRSMSAAAGVTGEERERIAGGDLGSAIFSPRDRAVLRFTAHVVGHPRVPDELFATVRSFLGDREIVEVLQLCGFYWTFCRIATVLEVEPPHGR